MPDIKGLAQRVDDAAHYAKEIPQLAEQITLTDAYAIQKESLGRRYARGERQVGIKMGFTSRAKMVQMGLSDVIWGRLAAGMQIEEGTAIDFSRFVHPRVEPEIAELVHRARARRHTRSASRGRLDRATRRGRSSHTATPGRRSA